METTAVIAVIAVTSVECKILYDGDERIVMIISYYGLPNCLTYSANLPTSRSNQPIMSDSLDFPTFPHFTFASAWWLDQVSMLWSDSFCNAKEGNVSISSCHVIMTPSDVILALLFTAIFNTNYHPLSGLDIYTILLDLRSWRWFYIHVQWDTIITGTAIRITLI